MSLLSCQLSIQDKPEIQSVLKVASAEQNCLAASLPVVQRYFSAKVNPIELSDAWDCFGGAVGTFLTYARGRNNNYFTAQEIRSFMERNFLDKLRISNDLLSETMAIKQLLVGGLADRITREELLHSLEVLQVLKAESLRLLPYVEILTLDADPKSKIDFEPAAKALIESSQAISGLFGPGRLGRSQKDYEIKRLGHFLEEFQSLFSRSSGWTGPQWIVDRIPLAVAAKAVLLRPGGSTIHSDEWVDLIQTGAKLYVSYLRFHYFLEGRDLWSMASLPSLTRLAVDSFAIVESAIGFKDNKQIEFAQINALVDEVKKPKIAKFKITAETTKALIAAGVNQVLTSVDRDGSRQKNNGLTLKHLNAARELVMGWLDMQRLWGELQWTAVARNPSLAFAPLPWSVVRELWSTLESPYQISYGNLKTVFQRPEPLTFSGDGIVVFSKKLDSHFVDETVFRSLNWKTLAARALIDGYSGDPAANRFKGLTAEEFQEFYVMIRPLGEELGLIAKDDGTLWNSIFNESNMFTLSANGDDHLGFNELIDYISYAESSSVVWHGIYRNLAGKCHDLGPDIFGFSTFDVECFRIQFQSKFSDYFNYFSHWTQLAAALGDPEWKAFQMEFENAARKGRFSDVPIDSTDLNRIAMVAHYIEGIFARFDEDNNGEFSVGEAKAAFPLFRKILTDFSGFESDDDVLALFTYLLKYGEPPGRAPMSLVKWKWWKNNPTKWELNADRRTLLRIIGEINHSTTH
jgi:hypothetical protein